MDLRDSITYILYADRRIVIFSPLQTVVGVLEHRDGSSDSIHADPHGAPCPRFESLTRDVLLALLAGTLPRCLQRYRMPNLPLQLEQP